MCTHRQRGSEENWEKKTNIDIMYQQVQKSYRYYRHSYTLKPYVFEGWEFDCYIYTGTCVQTHNNIANWKHIKLHTNLKKW